MPHAKPRILVFDIETAPIIAFVWSIWEQNVALNQIEKDWHILSWAAKWLDEKEVMYKDQRHSKNVEDDKNTLQGIWDLLDEADIVITQNGKAFDQKKLNARFILNGMRPPSMFRHIDVKQLAKKHFAFTSNKLEYLSDKINKKYKKLKHEKFSGFELWRECLKGNVKAWREMEKYNKYDVLALEELYKKIIPWDNSISLNVYQEKHAHVCTCGSKDFQKYGFRFTETAKYQRYLCNGCGKNSFSKVNLLSPEKKKSLKEHGFG